MPTFGSLFAGVGGFDLGLERAGWTCAWQVELDDACQRVLERRWPRGQRHADVRTVRCAASGEGIVADAAGEQWSSEPVNGLTRVDLLVGGFPCQDLSVAGQRAGLSGDRSSLFHEIVRIAKAIQPTWGIFENVPGLLSSHRGRDMALVIAGLRECWPVVGYRILDSRYFGVAQRRRRVFFVCGPTEEGVRQTLFEPEGGAGDLATGGEAGARVAASLTSGSHGAGVNAPGRRKEDDVNLVTVLGQGQGDPNVQADMAYALDCAPHANIVSEAVAAKWSKGTGGPSGDECQNLVAATLNSGGNNGGFRTEPGAHLITHALSAEGCDASEDGTGRGTPIVIQDVRAIEKDQNGLGVSDEDVAYTVDAQATQGVCIAFDPTSSLDQAPSDMTAPPLKVGSGIASMPWAPAVAFREDQRTGQVFETDVPSGIANGGGKPGQGYPAIRESMGVRRLSPVECERLQGFPDGWTCTCGADWSDPEAAECGGCTCPDTPRYKQMGNAVTVTVIEWIGRRLMEVLTAR